MKEDQNISDELLGRWLSGEISDEALKMEVGEDAYLSFVKIADASKNLQVDLDYNHEVEFSKLQNVIASKKSKETKARSLFNYRNLSIAAGFTILIGLGMMYLLMDSTTEDTRFATVQGETDTYVLPDKSTVALNVASEIIFNEETWSDNKEVELVGEAYFTVTKGQKFDVVTDQGTISVLGTEFNVRNRNHSTEVICYEGKVQVEDLKGNSIILLPNDAAKIVNGNLENWNPPVTNDAEWKNGFSSYHNADFIVVVEELENQYGIQVDIEDKDESRLYSGAFPHDNLDQALELVFSPMGIQFEYDKSSMVLKLK